MILKGIPVPQGNITITRHDEHLQWLLQRFVDKVPGVTQAVLASRDGIKLVWVGMDVDAADELSAALSGLRALAFPLASVNEDMHQVVVQFPSVTVYVMRTSDRGADYVSEVLAVRAGPAADPRVVGHEMAALITGVEEHLTTPVRDRAQ
ncbi:roadblock/LC7 domain-containing protein [Streptomyces sp. MZ04]|uniref:roadblock/LC7 domain-containing protein n=1 Tax=Streptomyces sp. MZ04 TaxID=2559236 RepID=UPI00107EC834|nr:roadblock/LC7 domain-containing protein [Streptomyces sp. MZ04]TGB15531.1 roadblock/LC7 domain-containing protein [Streptomyces sp. MZ04]